MKKYIITFLIIVLLVTGIYGLNYFGIINLESLKGSSSSSGKPQTRDADITVEIYLQEPNSGQMQKQEELYLSVEPKKVYEYQPQAKEYYYVDLTNSILITQSASDSDILKVFYLCESCTVTFLPNGGECVSGETEQVLRKGQTPTPPEFYKTGYFVSGYDIPIAPVYADTQFQAIWEVAKYTLTLNLTVGATLSSEEYVKSEQGSNCYTKQFTYFSESFSLPLPTFSGYNFIEWNTLSSGEGETYQEIANGTENSITLYSIFNVTTYEIDFEGPQNYDFESIVAPANTPIYPPIISAQMQIAGQGINWYTDADCTQLYTFTVMPENNITLYGKWEYDTGTGILDWDFSDRKIESERELILFLDYIAFNNITEENKITATVTFVNYSQIKDAITQATEYMEFAATSAMSYYIDGYNNSPENYSLTAYVTNADNSLQKELLSTEYNLVTPYKYIDYEYTGRGEYSDFYIEKLPNSYPVSTSNQLIYVVEHGFKPICATNSSAGNIYNKAKSVLNGIIEEDFTQYQKAVAIFDYLTTNIQYDINATLLSENVKWTDYNAFYLEGVFNDKKAVCDGISKAFSLMCNMEGIPCVQVTGNQHAWCKVKLNNRWTIVDPTHGNTLINGTQKSVIAHEFFGHSEEQKKQLGYTSVLYSNIVANYSINYFENKYFKLNGSLKNYVVSNSNELRELVGSYSNVKSLRGCVIEFCYLGSALKNDISRALTLSGRRETYYYLTSATSNGTVVKILFEE